MNLLQTARHILELEAKATPGAWQIDCGVSERSAWAISQWKGPDCFRLNGSENIYLDVETNQVEENLNLTCKSRNAIKELCQALLEAGEVIELYDDLIVQTEINGKIYQTDQGVPARDWLRKYGGGGEMIDLDILEQKAKAATPGPWRLHGSAVFFDHPDYPNEWIGLRGPTNSVDSDNDSKDENGFTRSLQVKDAKFIAAANPSVVLELIGEIRRLAKHCIDKNNENSDMIVELTSLKSKLAVAVKALEEILEGVKNSHPYNETQWMKITARHALSKIEDKDA